MKWMTAMNLRSLDLNLLLVFEAILRRNREGQRRARSEAATCGDAVKGRSDAPPGRGR
jgi:hypothetical protein